YGMYSVSAGINDVEVKKVRLSENFELESRKVLEACNNKTKLIFLCSPNNPSGNLLNKDEIINIVQNFEGIVIVDEAYIDFAPGKTLLAEINNFPKLVILQTFSKAWGLAGIRLGMAFTSPEIINILNKIKFPYNINSLTQQKVIETLKNTSQKENWVKIIINERERLAKELNQFNFVKKIHPSDANFLLVKMDRAREMFEFLMDKGVIVRDRSKVALCEGSLRITVGSPAENDKLIQYLTLQQ
nr:aminotransferase class I/II-fold pyridoxal phosphate-dependent enzyme [Prolixibacteraceae bacterium]